ncbi:MAG: class I SAM-dependent methyltransferase [bacterium]|nr:class I SAM-dependent methyltransferase [bacterium]
MHFNKKAFFWNLIAAKYSRQPVANEAAYQYKLKQTQAYLNPDSRVFEFGCGTGSTSIYHAPKVKHILAADISAQMIRIAKEKALAQGVKNLEFVCSAIEDLVLEPQGFDVVLAMSILHLVEDRAAVLNKIYQALTPGGHLITSTICVKDATPALGWIAPVGYFLGLLPLIRCFTHEELKSSLTQAGFTLIESWQPSPKEASFLIAKKEKEDEII